VRHIQPGAGGYGDPLERNPELVLEDVLDDKFGIDYVRKEYGVVINPKDMTVDEVSTSRLRKRLPTTGKRGHESSKHVKNYVRSLGLRLAEIGSPKKQH
jgi:N-methylhydantoinase B/oxoprolinase/acetone carboxylase alpha subunit